MANLRFTDEDLSKQLDSVDSANTGPGITVSDINNYTPLSPEDKAIYDHMYDEKKGTGALSKDTYFPSADNNINKGSYSGSIVGNVPIYASSNLFPLGIADARQDAINKAAAKKAARLNEFYSLYTKAPELKNANQQDKVNEEYFSWLTKSVANAKKSYGDNWVQALSNNPEFARQHNNFVTIKNKENQLYDSAAQIQKDISDPNKFVPVQARAAMQKTLSNVRDLSRPGVDISSDISAMTAYGDFSKELNDEFDKVSPQITEDVKKNGFDKDGKRLGGGIYDVLESTKTKTYTADQKDRISKNLQLKYKGVLSPNEIQDMVNQKAKDQVEKTFQTVENQFRPDANSGFGYNSNVSILNPATENGKTVDTFGGKPHTVDVTHQGGTSFASPITTQVTGQTVFVQKTGKVKHITNTQDFQTQRIVEKPVFVKDSDYDSLNDKGEKITKVIPKGTVVADIPEDKLKILREQGRIKDMPVADGILKGVEGDDEQVSIPVDMNFISTVASKQNARDSKQVVDYWKGKIDHQTTQGHEKPKTVKQNGVTYTLNEVTGQYE